MRFIKVKAHLNIPPRAGVITEHVVMLNGQEYGNITVVDQSDIQKL